MNERLQLQGAELGDPLPRPPGNSVIVQVGNYVIVNHTQLGNSVIADTIDVRPPPVPDRELLGVHDRGGR